VTAGRILFYVQHLLGVGHVYRAATVVRNMVQAGLHVTVVQGGFDVPGVTFDGAETLRLSPARAADSAFSKIIDEEGKPISDTWKSLRTSALLDAYKNAAPDVVVIELYPFGRRAFAFELDPLLKYCHAQQDRPWVICSLRDVLVKKTKPGRDKKIANTVVQYFDKVLVHGDPNFITLDETFSEVNLIEDRLVYTGLVADTKIRSINQPRQDQVIVSGGGGAVATDLFSACLQALPKTKARDWTWRFLCGPNLPDHFVKDLKSKAPKNAVFEPNRPDFSDLLSRSRLSISQAGYNTTMDVIQAGVPALLIPFAEPGETEQTLRANKLSRLNSHISCLHLPLNTDDIAHSIDAIIDIPVATESVLDTEGAQNSVEILRSLISIRPTSLHQ